MTFAVEMLIERTIQVPNGKTLSVSSNRLRYELDLESRTEGDVEPAPDEEEGGQKSKGDDPESLLLLAMLGEVVAHR